MGMKYCCYRLLGRLVAKQMRPCYRGRVGRSKRDQIVKNVSLVGNLLEMTGDDDFVEKVRGAGWRYSIYAGCNRRKRAIGNVGSNRISAYMVSCVLAAMR
jgi:hypothetical protein